MELILPITLHNEKAAHGVEQVINALNQKEQAGMRIDNFLARQWKITLDLEDNVTAVIAEAENDNVDISSLFWFGTDDQWRCDITTEEVLDLLRKKYGRAISNEHFADKTLKISLGVGVKVSEFTH